MEIDFNRMPLARGGGQGFWQCKCLNSECNIILFESYTNDRTSPSQVLCPFCCEEAEKVGDTPKTTKITE